MKKMYLKINGVKKNIKASNEFMLLEAVDALNNSVCAHYGEKVVYEQEMTIIVELTGDVPFYIMELTRNALDLRGLDYTLAVPK